MSISTKRQSKISAKSVGICLIVIGIATVIMGLYNIITIAVRSSDKEAVIQKNTTVQATVDKVWTERVRKSRSAGGKRYYVTEYHVNASYEYKDLDYTASNLNLGSKQISEGKTITIYIDPDNPSRAVYGFVSNKTGEFIARGLIAFVGLMMGIIGILVYKKKLELNISDLNDAHSERIFTEAHPNPSFKEIEKHYENYGKISDAELTLLRIQAQQSGNSNEIFRNTPSNDDLYRLYNDPAKERRERAEQEQYQNSRGFGSNYITNPNADFEKGSTEWEAEQPPIYDTPPEYQASRYARPSPIAGMYDPNVTYRSPDENNLDPISPFTTDNTDDDDEWGFLGGNEKKQ